MAAMRPLRWIGLLLLLGVILFSIATIVAEPFEQATSLGLYQAIVKNSTTYQVVNLLAGVGFVVLVAAVAFLGSFLPPSPGRLTQIGLTLLVLATLLWLSEILGRLTLTAATANQVGAGTAPPTTFPANLGIGLEPLFVAFLVATLIGLAIWFWQLGPAGVLSPRLSLLGAVVILASGSIAALTYPWVGGVERALFYPFVLVLLPFSIFLLVRRQRASSQKPIV